MSEREPQRYRITEFGQVHDTRDNWLLTEAEIIVLLNREADYEAMRAALEKCWGQQENGDLCFVVRVSGIGARPDSPQAIAHELAALWSETYARGVMVHVDESSRVLLACLKAQEEGA